MHQVSDRIVASGHQTIKTIVKAHENIALARSGGCLIVRVWFNFLCDGLLHSSQNSSKVVTLLQASLFLQL